MRRKWLYSSHSKRRRPPNCCFLRFQLAIQDEQLEELQMAHDRHAITAPSLVPLPQPEQGNDFLSDKARRNKFVLLRNYHLCVHCSFESLFCIHVWIHRPILSIISIDYPSVSCPGAVHVFAKR